MAVSKRKQAQRRAAHDARSVKRVRKLLEDALADGSDVLNDVDAFKAEVRTVVYGCFSNPCLGSLMPLVKQFADRGILLGELDLGMAGEEHYDFVIYCASSPTVSADTLCRLLMAGAPVDIQGADTTPLLAALDAFDPQHTPLFENKVSLLLQFRADPFAVDAAGRSPLAVALARGCPGSVVRRLRPDDAPVPLPTPLRLTLMREQ
jgi:hypothetical protein